MSKIELYNGDCLEVMSNNKTDNLNKAKKARNDEFYTQYSDIEKEMQAYLEFNEDVFRGKSIFMPCDDPDYSDFTKHFTQNFERYGIKKLISTSYVSNGRGKIFSMVQGSDEHQTLDVEKSRWSYLDGDGDFRSNEINDIAKSCDIIITNPPFSMFQDFLIWVVGLGKEFSVIGSMNAITYKHVFPLIRDNKLWLGFGSKNGGNSVWFKLPQNAALNKHEKLINGIRSFPVSSKWYTNIEHGRRNEPLQLMTMKDNLTYNKKVIKNKGTINTIYQKYDNYDAIEVSYTDAIPSDYDGVMGVPISFLDKYNPNQFEILGCNRGVNQEDTGTYGRGTYINGKEVFKRIFIQHKRSVT